jgi:hypothetical protein
MTMAANEIRMKQGDETLQYAIRRLNARAWGMSVGFVLGFGLLIATNVLVIKGGPNVGQHLGLLSNYFPGYRVTFVGLRTARVEGVGRRMVMSERTEHGGPGGANLSLIMPCYNEEESVPVTIPRLVAAFREAGHRLELVAVDNGSTDSTADMLRRLAAEYPEVQVETVTTNIGYGNGLLSGVPRSTAPWIGFIPADGQVDAADVVHLYESAAASHGDVVAKARRRFRMDGLWRKIVSVSYNLLVRVLWPRLDTLDVNGTPKILPRDALIAMELESRGWFLDPEIMIKSHYMGLRVLEFNVFARMRGSGTSHVRKETCLEFLRNLAAYRFTSKLGVWRRGLGEWRNPSNHMTAQVGRS